MQLQIGSLPQQMVRRNDCVGQQIAIGRELGSVLDQVKGQRPHKLCVFDASVFGAV